MKLEYSKRRNVFDIYGNNLFLVGTLRAGSGLFKAASYLWAICCPDVIHCVCTAHFQSFHASKTQKLLGCKLNKPVCADHFYQTLSHHWQLWHVVSIVLEIQKDSNIVPDGVSPLDLIICLIFITSVSLQFLLALVYILWCAKAKQPIKVHSFSQMNSVKKTHW